MKMALLVLLISLSISPARAEDPAPENGNSAFAVNLLSQLTPQEYAYYDGIFTNLMNYEPPSANYAWKSGSASGLITTSARFSAPGGGLCRPFSESYTVAGKSQTRSGIACRREDGQSWCRLRASSTYDCKLEPRGGIDGLLDEGAVRVNRWDNKVREWKFKLDSLF